METEDMHLETEDMHLEPETFPEANNMLGKNQAGVIALPCHTTDDGRVVICWKVSHRQLEEIAKTGYIWQQVYTYGKAFQPQMLHVDNPFES